MTNARRANGTARTKLRSRVLREETHCHLCDQPVDRKLPHGLPGSPEVDEIIPIAYGGNPLDRRNCRLAHRYCNRLRWHRPIAIARQQLATKRPRFATNGSVTFDTPAARPSRQW